MEVHRVSLSKFTSLPVSKRHSRIIIVLSLINSIMIRVTSCTDLYILWLYKFLTMSCKVQLRDFQTHISGR